MAPKAEALPKSESKKNFLKRIGLDETRMRDRRLYDLMKREASDGRGRIIADLRTEDPSGYDHQASFGPDGEEFYPSSYIGDQALSDEALRVYATACPDTRAIYDLAYDPDRPNDANWIIRWFLWHVFRYRDGRQARQKINQTATTPVRPAFTPGARIKDNQFPSLRTHMVRASAWPCSWRPLSSEDSSQLRRPRHSQSEEASDPKRYRYDPVRDIMTSV